MNEVNDKKKNLYYIKKFLETDLKVKETLYQIAPTQFDDYDESSRMEYIDKLDEELKYLKYDVLDSIRGFHLGDEVENAISDFFDRKKEELIIGRFTKGINQSVYSKNFSNMDLKFVEDVKRECFGHLLSRDESFISLIKEAKTVNELLHLVHTYIINNEKILESAPNLAEKKLDTGYYVTLRGEENDVASIIFKDYPLDGESGITDILSLENKIFIMVRDLGHALLIEIDTTNKDEIAINYFIPKICNRKMVEALPGVDLGGITDGANGFFISSKENLSRDLFNFIERVPTDFDIESNQNQPLYQDINMQSNQPIEQDINIQQNQNLEQDTNIQSNQKFEQEIKTNPESIFSVQDAKEIAKEKGIKGRIISIIRKFQEFIKQYIVKEKNIENYQGENQDERDK